MSEFFLELFSEEIPSKLQVNARKSLSENLRNTEKIINPLLESLGVRLYKSYKRIGDQKAELFCTDDDDKVISKIEELKSIFFKNTKEFESEDCIILSASKRGIKKQGKLHGYLERQKNEKNGIEFTTVRKFKG